MKFNLVNYTQDIRNIAETNKASVAEALQMFISNLTTMREHYAGASHLNYHQLGQQWNKLLSDEKVAQKADTFARLSKHVTRGKE